MTNFLILEKNFECKMFHELNNITSRGKSILCSNIHVSRTFNNAKSTRKSSLLKLIYIIVLNSSTPVNYVSGISLDKH